MSKDSPPVTPFIQHPSIKMRLRGERQDLERCGDFRWEGTPEKRVLLLAIPSLHPTAADYDFFHSEWTINHLNESGAKWSWDQKKEAPTLQPSLHAKGIWRGWVQAGRIIEHRSEVLVPADVAWEVAREEWTLETIQAAREAINEIKPHLTPENTKLAFVHAERERELEIMEREL